MGHTEQGPEPGWETRKRNSAAKSEGNYQRLRQQNGFGTADEDYFLRKPYEKRQAARLTFEGIVVVSRLGFDCDGTR